MIFPEKRLGFGLMRLPRQDGVIDIDRVSAMVDEFLAQGYTYFDTAYVYEGSEEALRRAVVERHDRSSFAIANKLPWLIQKPEDRQAIFDESLRRCGVDYFDYYLLHCVRKVSYETYKKFHCFEFLQELKAAGKVRHIGFSFHDTPELLDEILTLHPEVEFVQLQLNYMDRENELVQSAAVHAVARRHNKPIVVMEPVKGGTLASLPPRAEALLRGMNPEASAASWALRYAAGLDGVAVVLSGMSDEQQLQDNMRLFQAPERLSVPELRALDEVTQILLDADTIACTGCRYCTKGCPMGILIPDLIRAYNNGLIYGFGPRQRNSYENHTSFIGRKPASACIGCGKCRAVCPQHLDVPALLKTVADKLEVR